MNNSQIWNWTICPMNKEKDLWLTLEWITFDWIKDPKLHDYVLLQKLTEEMYSFVPDIASLMHSTWTKVYNKQLQSGTWKINIGFNQFDLTSQQEDWRKHRNVLFVESFWKKILIDIDFANKNTFTLKIKDWDKTLISLNFWYYWDQFLNKQSLRQIVALANIINFILWNFHFSLDDRLWNVKYVFLKRLILSDWIFLIEPKEQKL